MPKNLPGHSFPFPFLSWDDVPEPVDWLDSQFLFYDDPPDGQLLLRHFLPSFRKHPESQGKRQVWGSSQDGSDSRSPKFFPRLPWRPGPPSLLIRETERENPTFSGCRLGPSIFQLPEIWVVQLCVCPAVRPGGQAGSQAKGFGRGG